MVLSVLAFVPHIEFANFFSRLFRVATFILVVVYVCLVAQRPVQCYTKYFGVSVSMILVATSWPLCSADETS